MFPDNKLGLVVWVPWNKIILPKQSNKQTNKQTKPQKNPKWKQNTKQTQVLFCVILKVIFAHILNSCVYFLYLAQLSSD